MTSSYHYIIVSDMRTTLTLDDDVAEAAASIARETGARLGAVVSDLARKGLERPFIRGKSKPGLPTFKCEPGDPIIPSSRAKDLLAEELP